MNIIETTVLFLQCIFVELKWFDSKKNFLQNTMLQSIERYMKQAIVDKNHAVSSAALVSSLVMLQEMRSFILPTINDQLFLSCWYE